MSLVTVDSWCENHKFLPCNCKNAIRAPKRNKYGAKKVHIDSFIFDSWKESKRYMVLKAREQAGEISNLEIHPEFGLAINGINVGTYTADFAYYDHDTSEEVIEDVKSNRRTGKKVSAKARRFNTRKLSAFRIKVFEAIYGRRVKIV